MSFRAYLAIAIVGLFSFSAFGQGYPVEIGERHPPFVLPNVDDGQPLSLSDYKGKKVLLVHFASW